MSAWINGADFAMVPDASNCRVNNGLPAICELVVAL